MSFPVVEKYEKLAVINSSIQKNFSATLFFLKNKAYTKEKHTIGYN